MVPSCLFSNKEKLLWWYKITVCPIGPGFVGLRNSFGRCRSRPSRAGTVRVTQPYDRACMPFRSPKGRLSIAAVLLIYVSVHPVEEGNQPVGGIKGGLCRGFDGGADIGPDGVLSPGLEGMNGAHVEPQARSQRLMTTSHTPRSSRKRLRLAVAAREGSLGRDRQPSRERGRGRRLVPRSEGRSEA